MKELRFGDFVWYKKQGWIFVGMDEDGAYTLARPEYASPFNVYEFEKVWLADDDDYDTFMEENGESLSEKHRRKGTLPE